MAQTSVQVVIPEKKTPTTAPKLNTDGSVVDYLKSTGKDSSFSSRTQLALQYGIVSNASQYVGSAAQNTSLLQKLRSGNAPVSPSQVKSPNDAGSFINGKQADDIASAKASDEPETRSITERYTSAFKEVTGMDAILPSGSSPERPSYEKEYNKLRKQYGMEALETRMNDLQTEADAIRSQFRAQRYDEEGKPVAMNVIEGRISEEEKAANERLDVINMEINTANRQLTAANSVIENTMNLKKMDYEAAKDEYNTKFSQNLDIFNLVKGLVKDEDSEAEAKADNARSNLQIITNALQESGKTLADATPATKYQVQKLELEAGLPTGFFESVMTSTGGKQEILSTTTRVAGGAKYADIIMRGADGSISVKTVGLGSSGSEGGGDGKLTEAEQMRAARSEMASNLNTRRGEDGYLSPADYKKAKSAWVTAGYSSEDFDDAFATTYVNQSHSQDYGVSNEYFY